MKVLVAVALFAFVALQLSQGSHDLETKYNSMAMAEVLSEHQLGLEVKNKEDGEEAMSHGAPVPDEEKKEDPAASSSPAPSEATSEASKPAEAKSEAPSSDAPAAPAAAAAAAAPAAVDTPAPAEEKKA